MFIVTQWSGLYVCAFCPWAWDCHMCSSYEFCFQKHSLLSWMYIVWTHIHWEILWSRKTATHTRTYTYTHSHTHAHTHPTQHTHTHTHTHKHNWAPPTPSYTDTNKMLIHTHKLTHRNKYKYTLATKVLSLKWTSIGGGNAAATWDQRWRKALYNSWQYFRGNNCENLCMGWGAESRLRQSARHLKTEPKPTL